MRYVILIACLALGAVWLGGQTLQSVKAKVLGFSTSESNELVTGDNGGWGS